MFARAVQEQGEADASCGIDESEASRLHDLLQIHAKPHADCGRLQEEFGEFFRLGMKWIGKRESVVETSG